MGVFFPYAAKCICGYPFSINLASAINAQLFPESCTNIIEGKYHRLTCPNCHRFLTIEREILYSDFSKSLIIRVMPKHDRHLWKQASEDLDNILTKIPSSLLESRDHFIRVVFGIDELREKLIAIDNGFDDKMVEILKVFLIYEHPFLINRTRLRLFLDKITKDAVEFIARYDHSPRIFRLGIPRLLVDEIVKREDEIKTWFKRSHLKSNIYDLNGDYWINFWRWSPQIWALMLIHKYSIDITEGKLIDTESKDFKFMIEHIPRGTHMPVWAKQDMHLLYIYAKKKKLSQLQAKIFQIKFGIVLEDDWSLDNDPDNIDTLWNLFQNMPNVNIEGNTFIHEIYSDKETEEGEYVGEAHDIYINPNVTSNQEKFEDVVRHEVGHAVYLKYQRVVKPWLKSRFGWRSFGRDSTEIDKWVKLMNGWGNIDVASRKEIIKYLIQIVGDGDSWTAGPFPNIPPNDVWWKPKFAPRLTYERTHDKWFEHNPEWYVFNGIAFFLNYWYAKFMCVNRDTLDLINRIMPSKYAAMSDLEFFAELYSLYYDLDEPKRLHLPKDILRWFGRNIGPVGRNIRKRPQIQKKNAKARK